MTLLLIPTKAEYKAFLKSLLAAETEIKPVEIGRMKGTEIRDRNVLVFQSGLGKIKTALSAQHLVDYTRSITMIICLGTAGALSPKLQIGDLVIGTRIIEYDRINPKADTDESPFPVYHCDKKAVRAMQQKTGKQKVKQTHFGFIASGDGDITSEERRQELAADTGALCTAWEGAGIAAAGIFNKLPFLEIRGISDLAGSDYHTEYEKNIPVVMNKLALLIKECYL